MLLTWMKMKKKCWHKLESDQQTQKVKKQRGNKEKKLLSKQEDWLNFKKLDNCKWQELIIFQQQKK